MLHCDHWQSSLQDAEPGKPLQFAEKQLMKYIASLSGGKDSTAMILKLIEEKEPLDMVVFFDTQMEFDCVYTVIDKIEKICRDHNINFIRMRSDESVWLTMLCRPVKDHYGYEWCGGLCRWGTRAKTSAIERYVEPGDIEYIGIAYDEQHRCNGKEYPLVKWKMTEKECLEYCHSKGFFWNEGEVELYSILDRVSCWCCGNKNLKELKAMYKHLPKYWGYLKGLQSRIDRPFRRDGQTIFDLEERFKREDDQLELDLFCEGENNNA